MKKQDCKCLLALVISLVIIFEIFHSGIYFIIIFSLQYLFALLFDRLIGTQHTYLHSFAYHKNANAYATESVSRTQLWIYS